MKKHVMYSLVLMFVVVFLGGGVVLGQDSVDDGRPPEVPPDAEEEVGREIIEFEDIVTIKTNIALKRIHSSKAQVGEKIEVILELTNRGDIDVELSLMENHISNIDYLDPIEKRILQYEGLKQPIYVWKMSLPAKTKNKVKYHIMSKFPKMLTFPPSNASDQYGNHFTSGPTSMKIVCIPDGNCDPGENFIFCPEDCTTGISDGLCDGVEDGKCDPDCTIEGDKDCGVMLSDLDGDGDVDFCDRSILWASLRKCDGDAGYNPDADYDGDGCITFNDYRIWYRYYKAFQSSG